MNREITRVDVMNRFIRERGYRRYLEIGTAAGESYRGVNAPVRVSVDPDWDTMATFRMTSDEFFASEIVEECFDIIFIDGLHTSDQAYRDVKNALRALCPGGVIVMHDCLPSSEIMQRPCDSYPGGEWTGDVWKAFVKLRFELPYRMYTLRTDYGCGIIDTRTIDRVTPKFYVDMRNLSWQTYCNNQDWMNIVEVNQNEW